MSRRAFGKFGAFIQGMRWDSQRRRKRQHIKKETVGYVEVSFLGPQCHLHSDLHPNPNPSLANVWNCQHPMSWFWNVFESAMSGSLVESTWLSSVQVALFTRYDRLPSGRAARIGWRLSKLAWKSNLAAIKRDAQKHVETPCFDTPLFESFGEEWRCTHWGPAFLRFYVFHWDLGMISMCNIVQFYLECGRSLKSCVLKWLKRLKWDEKKTLIILYIMCIYNIYNYIYAIAIVFMLLGYLSKYSRRETFYLPPLIRGRGCILINPKSMRIQWTWRLNWTRL